MRWIIKDIMEHCMKPDKDGKRNKLLRSEEIPASAWPELTPTNYIKDFKKSWTKLTPEEKALYDQDELDFLVLLSMDPNHVYTGVEIQGTLDSAIAERGLRLVIARRSGQFKAGVKVSPHTKYNALLDHNEDSEEPFLSPVFSTTHDIGRSLALRRFVWMLAPISEVVSKIATTHLNASSVPMATDSPIHVQKIVLPDTAPTVKSYGIRMSNVVDPVKRHDPVLNEVLMDTTPAIPLSPSLSTAHSE
ncbi:hypothetical protein VC83_02491 [Pseudogymnoascus destructans]|uniref:Uncharacterized protein n=2 Tax=Pseudogymnoascus destructans TaxID=655981 RepID=L8FYF5_PSED2|nr:uncharacterized protein VC83_02491 [Pseudogymnoascus destructans]ELR05907.1 hypothetical protein GMDG_07680 [Pseudogymnoascus destructans 20631-21]OAF60823.1 hypothetical protein VC83_02491 [Pseudogymnoascus destructans]